MELSLPPVSKPCRAEVTMPVGVTSTGLSLRALKSALDYKLPDNNNNNNNTIYKIIIYNTIKKYILIMDIITYSGN